MSGVGDNARVELAHISDLHLPLPTQPAPWGSYWGKRLLGWLNLRLKRHHPPEIAAALAADLRARPPDHLAVTGDLTNLSLQAEFEAAAAWLRGLGLPPARLSVIPGNHDAYVRQATRRRWFEAALGPVLGQAELRWPRAQRVGEVLLVSTSSAVPSPWGCAWGRLGAAQLAAADELLAADAATRVVLVHHPPVLASGQPDRRWRRNLDWEPLLALCARRGVDMILCGHTHRPFRRRLERGWVFCAGSTTDPPREGRVGERAVYNRYRFEAGRLVGLEVRGFDPARGEFVRLSEEALSA